MKVVSRFVLVALISISSSLVAQGPPPPPPGTPINNGLIFLLIAGVLYGIKKNQGLKR